MEVLVGVESLPIALSAFVQLALVIVRVADALERDALVSALTDLAEELE
jgi:hypothetical protein